MGLIEEFIEKYPEEMAEAQMRRKAVKKLLADYDKTLREQIARGILEIGIPELPQGHEDNPTFIAIRTAQEVMRLRAAAKARGNKE